MSSTLDADSVWFYIPNLGAAIAFAVAFAIITSGVTYRSFQVKGRRAFFWTVSVGLIFEIVGFCLRAVGHNRLDEVGPFASQQSLIVLAPLFIAAGNYLVASRTICAASKAGQRERILRIPARWITKIFVTCDIITILIQVSGTTISATVNWVGPTSDIGSNVLLSGLAVQSVTVAFFIVVLLTFGGSELFALRPQSDHLLGMKSGFISSVCIELRCVYRLVEHATGYNGYLFTHEWNFYLFEALPMIIATAVFVVWYPPRYVPLDMRHASATESRVDGKEGAPERGLLDGHAQV